jgi:hypothetical protein
MQSENKENIVCIDGEDIKESDLTPDQLHHKNHVVSLRNKLAKLRFEMDDLMPSLKFHEDALIEVTKKQAEKELGEEKPTIITAQEGKK